MWALYARRFGVDDVLLSWVLAISGVSARVSGAPVFLYSLGTQPILRVHTLYTIQMLLSISTSRSKEDIGRRLCWRMGKSWLRGGLG